MIGWAYPSTDTSVTTNCNELVSPEDVLYRLKIWSVLVECHQPNPRFEAHAWEQAGGVSRKAIQIILFSNKFGQQTNTGRAFEKIPTDYPNCWQFESIGLNRLPEASKLQIPFLVRF